MPTLYAGRRAAKGHRPSPPYGINRQHEHAQGLIAWVPMEGLYGIDRILGSTVNPFVAAAGTSISGTSGWAGMGPAIDLGGNQTAIASLPHNALYNQPNFTTAVWCRTDQTTPSLNTAWARSTQAFAPGMWTLGFTAATGIPRFHISFTGGGQQNCSDTVAWSATTTPLLMVGTYDGVTMRIFIQGLQRNTVTVTEAMATVTQGLSVYGRSDNSGVSDSNWVGHVFDCRYYNRVLSAAEIWSLYDPATRWDLYWVPGRRVYFDLAAAPSTGRVYSYILN